MSPRIPVRLLHGRPSRQQGTTLIEALVAVVVLSIGLLGMAGLQANALKLNQTSMQRSQATILAYSILDQMRSDTAAAKAGDYDLAFDGEPAEGSALETWLDEVTRSLGASARGRFAASQFRTTRTARMQPRMSSSSVCSGQKPKLKMPMARLR